MCRGSGLVALDVGDFGTIPARKSGDGYEQACGHTRVEALRHMGATRVEVTVHDYGDEKMLAVMTAENATQRRDQFGPTQYESGSYLCR